MRRNRWRVGRYLITDDESGFVHYDDEIVERWDGILFRKRGNEDEIGKHPQLFVRALDDPRALEKIRPQFVAAALNIIDIDKVQGVVRSKGAADHLFLTTLDGIEEMAIEGTPPFTVRDDG